MAKKAKNTKIVGLDGPPCPRCGCPTEIREHERITAEELAKSFYYSRWYNCQNRGCKTTAIMPDEFKVWKNEAQRSQDVVTMPTEPTTVLKGRSAISLPITLHRRPPNAMLSS